MNNLNKPTLTLSDANFDAEVLNSDVPVLVDFWAEWCQPCRIVGPTIDALARDFAGRVKVGKFEMDTGRKPLEYGIRSIPTVILFQDGEIRSKWIGVQPKESYAEEIEKLLLEAASTS